MQERAQELAASFNNGNHSHVIGEITGNVAAGAFLLAVLVYQELGDADRVQFANLLGSAGFGTDEDYVYSSFWGRELLASLGSRAGKALVTGTA